MCWWPCPHSSLLSCGLRFLFFLSTGKLHVYLLACACTQSCPTLCSPVDYSPPGSSFQEKRGILQARILGWVAIPFSRGSSWPRDRTQASHTTKEAVTCLLLKGSLLVPLGEAGWWWGRCKHQTRQRSLDFWGSMITISPCFLFSSLLSFFFPFLTLPPHPPWVPSPSMHKTEQKTPS